MTEAPITTASTQSYSHSLSFNSSDVSSGEAITFLDQNTAINISLTNDGNGNWKATISCAHPNTNIYDKSEVKPGTTLPLGSIGAVNYSIQFSDQPGKRIFEAIIATITGLAVPN